MQNTSESDTQAQNTIVMNEPEQTFYDYSIVRLFYRPSPHLAKTFDTATDTRGGDAIIRGGDAIIRADERCPSRRRTLPARGGICSAKADTPIRVVEDCMLTPFSPLWGGCDDAGAVPPLLPLLRAAQLVLCPAYRRLVP